MCDFHMICAGVFLGGDAGDQVRVGPAGVEEPGGAIRLGGPRMDTCELRLQGVLGHLDVVRHLCA